MDFVIANDAVAVQAAAEAAAEAAAAPPATRSPAGGVRRRTATDWRGVTKTRGGNNGVEKYDVQ